MSVISNNPNASASGATTLVSALLVWGLGALGVPITAEMAVIAAGVLISAVLYVGKSGIKGIFGRVWGGEDPGPHPDHPTDGGVG